MNTKMKTAAIATMLLLIGGVQESNARSLKKLEGKIVSASLDEETGKIKVVIKTEKWCAPMDASLVSTIAGRASFGPFHYEFRIGLSATKGCIGEREREVLVDAPKLIVKNEAHIVIFGEDGTSATVVLPAGYNDRAVAYGEKPEEDRTKSFEGSVGDLGASVINEDVDAATESSSSNMSDVGPGASFEDLQALANDEGAAGGAR